MLILASASQSRKHLLESASIHFDQISSDVDESSIENKKIIDLASELSSLKANSVLNTIIKDKVKSHLYHKSLEILGCDSIFEFKGKAFGKPANKTEAFDRWKNMSSQNGFLHTGHTLLFCSYDHKNNELLIYDEIKKTISSKIYFAKLQEKEISKYVESLEPLYCAGGFALEGRGGKYIEKIEGCFSNVMGLSLPWLRKELLQKGIIA